MKLLLTSCVAALVFTCALVQAAPAARPGGGVRRAGMYGGINEAGAERIRRAQYNPKQASRYKKQRRQGGASSTPGNRNCQYNGPQPDTSACANTDTADGCTNRYFEVESTRLQLEGGYTFDAGGHVNFQYIPLSEYQGFGSYEEPDPEWNVESGGLNFDPNVGQPGAEWIGRDYFDWSAGADLPEEGYCIIWVQVDDFNPHFGEGGQGPVCYCANGRRINRM